MQEAIRDFEAVLADKSAQLSERLEGSLERIDEALEEMSESWKSSLDEEELERLQRGVNDFLAQFERLGTELQMKFKHDLLPQLQRHLEDLRERYRQQGREDDADQVEAMLDQLTSV